MKENKNRSQSQSQSKNSISQNKIPQPSSYSNGIKYPKKNINNSSSHSISSITVNKNLDFKDSLEGSISESRTNLLIPDSLNNTKSSIGNNFLSKKNSKKKLNKKENNLKENGIKNTLIMNNGEKTKKIDYRFFSQFSFKFGGEAPKKNEKNNKYWLAVYDKLMKTKKILKILSYYEKEKNKKEIMINNNDNNYNYINPDSIKEQLLIIKDFDIYFMKPLNRPFIKYVKGNCIFTKIYLLTFEQIIFILNYINRYNLPISSKISNLLLEKGSYQKINEVYKNFPYNMIYGMGSYMNINIIGFTNYNIQDKSNLTYNYLNQNYPNSRKIAKLVKLLMINFPKYSFKFFVCYLLSKIRFENFGEKTNEIKNIVYSTNKSFMPLKTNKHFKLISNSLIHSSYSPLSNYDDLSEIHSRDIKNNTENNNLFNNNININNNNYKNNYLAYKQKLKLKENNLSQEFHTYDNINYKYYNTKKENKNNEIINKNRNNKTKNLSERKNNFKKHTESVYINGYVGTANNMYNINNLIFNKSKTKKPQKELNTSIKKLINNFSTNNSSSISKNKKRLNKSEIVRIKPSLRYNTKINYLQIKKKNNQIENGINKIKEKKGSDIFNEDKKNSKKIKKFITNTKSEETKICSNNKDFMNNSYKAEINKENTGIFVVSKKIITDDFIDDDSSLEGNNRRNNNDNNDNENEVNNGQSMEYMTPEKKKRYKYYS